jgi:hypothetical protein
MAISDELLGFVRDALGRGLPRKQIEDALRQAKWEPAQVKGALAEFAEVDFPIPVPRPRPYLSAREAFMYLVLFSTLYVSAYNFGTLLFQFINGAFPDPAASGWGDYSDTAVRWSVSSLIVAFPVYLYVSLLISRAIRQDPGKRASKIRRWLTYLTLFVAAGVLIGDFIALVYNFLGGELTTRFVLKVATVGCIAGAVFGYYLWSLRHEEKEIEKEKA